MIKVEIGPGRIERLTLESKTELERDLDHGIYLSLKSDLDRIDAALRRAAETFLAERK
jgi:hypothetical protein